MQAAAGAARESEHKATGLFDDMRDGTGSDCTGCAHEGLACYVIVKSLNFL